MANDLQLRMDADTAGFERGFARAQRAARDTGRELDRLHTTLNQLEGEIGRGNQKLTAELERRSQVAKQFQQDTGRAMIAAGTAILTGLGLATKAAIDWESAWAGVRKTTDGSPQEMAQLETELRKLARTLPATHTEIAAVAEAAGALGVSREHLAAFTKTAIDLGETTNLTAEEAATSLAKLANLMGVDVGQSVQRMGSALVALGNDGASTEDEIAALSLRIAGAGRIVNLSTDEVLGWSGALANAGIEAEAGGTAISRVFLTIDSAVKKGGREVEKFAAVAGMSVDEFSTAFRDDASAATSAFLQGLQGLSAQGADVVTILSDMELGEIRVRDAVLRLSSSHGGLSHALEVANTGWDENAALLKEANERYGTNAAKIEIARNQVTDLAIDLAGTLAPAVGGTAERVGVLAEMVGGLPGPVKSVAGVVGALAGVVALAGGAFLLAAPKVAAFKAAMADLGPRSQMFGRGLAGIAGILAGPWGLALGAGIAALGFWINKKAEAEQTVRQFTDALRADEGALGVNTRALVVNRLEQDGILRTATELGVSLADVTEAALGNDAALRRLAEATREAAAEGSGHRMSVVELLAALGEMRGATEAARDATERETEALGANADAGDTVTTSMDDVTAAMGEAKTAAEILAGEIDALTGVEITVEQASLRWHDAVDAVTAAIGENGNTLDVNTEKGRANRSSLLAAIEAANEHAQAVADQSGSVAAGSKALAGHRDALVQTAINAGLSEAAAQDYVDQLLKIPTAKATTVTLSGIENAMAQLAEYNRRLNATPGTGQFTSRPMAGGGLVTGPGGPTDDRVPIAASAGEYMQPARAVDHYGLAFMEAVRTLSLPRFASGGLIPRPVGGGPATRGGDTYTITVDGPAYVAEAHRIAGAIETERRRVDAVRGRV